MTTATPTTTFSAAALATLGLPAATGWDAGDLSEYPLGDYVLGCDLGGTNLKFAAVRDEIIHRDSLPVPTGDARSPEGIVNLFRECALACADEFGTKPAAIGVGVPGAVDYDRGLVMDAPAFPLWRKVPMLELLADGLGIPAVIDNDANFYALGEALRGAGRGLENVVVLTLGTGVGGGIVLGGKVFHGDRGIAGEVGHVIVERDGRDCGCGARGCLELYAASRAFPFHAGNLKAEEREAFLKRAEVDIDELTPEVIASMIAKGDVTAATLWKEFSSYLGMGIASMVSVLGVTTFIVGGGIAKSFDRLHDPVLRGAAPYLRESSFEMLNLIEGELGSEAGPLGAASAAWELVRG